MSWKSLKFRQYYSWFSNSRVLSCSLLVASWYQKHKFVLNEWVDLLFCKLYYILSRVASWTLNDSCDELQHHNYELSYSFHKAFMSWNCYFDKFYELLKLQVTSNFTLWHILRIKVSYNIFIILAIPQIIHNFKISCDIKKIIKID